MSRPFGKIPRDNGMPEPGPHACKCLGTRRGISEKKHTPYLELKWITEDGREFTDSLFITGKAKNRLIIVADHVCHIDPDTPMPDNDDDLVIELEKFIDENISGKYAIVTIEEYEETFIHEAGPKVGQKETKTKRKVAFNGYEGYEKPKEEFIENEIPGGKPPNPADEELPF
jgi:hypothetical protein